jgi:hypothetical protein
MTTRSFITMHDLSLAFAFVTMIIAPCLVAIQTEKE